MTNVLLLQGGASNEREVSLRSGAAVRRALETAGYRVTVLDPIDGHMDLRDKPDVVFPVLHGSGGEDGTIQAELEKLKIPYVGSAPAASALCFDKWRYKQAILHGGLPAPEAELVNARDFDRSALSRQPYVLKPVKGGSSLDTFIVRNPSITNEAAIQTAFAKYGDMLIERLVEGVEITLGVLGDQTLPVIEIIPPRDAEFDYDNKYNGKTRELCPPAHVRREVQERAQAMALAAHRLSGCRDLSRTDMIIDRDNNPWVLETNTLPGMTDQSLFPKAAATAGIPMPELTDRLVRMALARQ